MHYYIGSWVYQDEKPGSDLQCFRPPIDRAGDWSVIDLRPDPSVVDGYCLIASDHVHTDPNLYYLGEENLDEVMVSPLKTAVENRLGITLDAPDLRGAIAEIMVLHGRTDGSRWRPLIADMKGMVEIRLRGLIYRAPQIVGATYTEDFDTSNQENLGPDLTWTDVQGDWDVVSNRAEINNRGSPVNYDRAEHTASTDDQYCEAEIINFGQPTSGGQSQFMPCVRFLHTGNSSYGFMVAEDSDGDIYKLRKTTTGTRSDITSDTGHTIALPETVKTTISGTTLKGWIDGTEKDSATDSSFSGSTYRRGGIYGYQAAQGTPALPAVDNFEFGDYTEPGIGGWGILPAS